MSVIAYDKPVKDFIAGLNATGHVTHTAFRKTSVTFHHNGGRLSLQGILDVWKVRPASAQFQVDGQGALGQYVKVNEYAWAAGNTQGNKESIHIEMANATLGPDWQVAEVTWKEAARLAGWLFARVIGVRPDRTNVFFHKKWKATLCAGPHMDSVYEHLLNEVQGAYGYFTTNPSAPAPVPAPPPGQGDITSVARRVIAGLWGNGDERRHRLQAAGYNADAVQAEVNRLLGGGSPAPAPNRKSIDQLVAEVMKGEWGNGSERSRRLSAAGYNSAEVQAAVNARMGGGTAPTRPSNGVIAQQVIAGQWGNGPERTRRLTAAGYNAAAVQAEVNRRLR